MTYGKGISEDAAHFTVRVTADQLDRLREIAESEHRTVSAEVRRLVERHVAQYDQAA